MDCIKAAEKAVKDWIESQPWNAECQTETTYKNASTQYLVEDLDKTEQVNAIPDRKDYAELSKSLF